MKLRNAVVGAVVAVAATLAQAQQMPQPGPEHDVLKQDVGNWDATIEMFPGPNQPPMLSKGTSTSRLLGGFWLVDEFKATLMGMPFEGHGTTGYDPLKKKYIGTWVDSMTPGLNLSESTWDEKAKTMSGTNEGPGPDGKPSKSEGVTQWQGPDKKVFSMYAPGPDGKNALMMRITYTRKK